MCLKNATKLRSGTLTVTLQTHVQESKSSIGQIGRFLRYWVLPSLRGSRCPRLRGPDCSLCAQTLANQTRKKVPRAIRVGGALQGRRPPSLPRRRCGPTLSDGPSPSLCWWALQIVASQKKEKKSSNSARMAPNSSFLTHCRHNPRHTPLTVTGCVHESPRGACDPTRCRETRPPYLCLHGRPPRTCARHVSARLRRRGEEARVRPPPTFLDRMAKTWQLSSRTGPQRHEQPRASP